MNPFVRIAAVARNLFRRRERDADLDAEVRGYVEMLADEKIRGGIAPDEARRQTRLESGGIEQVKQQVRESRAGAWLDTLLQDARYGLRQLRRNPGFATVAILTLALGIGANTAIFSIVDSVLLRPLPYPGIDRMVVINEALPNTSFMNDSWPDFLDWRAQNQAFERMAALRPQGMTLLEAGDPKHEFGAFVSASFFPMLGVKPAVGRLFTDADDRAGAPPVAAVSYAFWRDALSGDPSWIGRALSVDGVTVTLVGVLPPNFQFPQGAYDVYVPISLLARDPEMAARANHPGIIVIATRRPGVSLAAARSDMSTIMSRLAREYPDSNRDEVAVMTPLLEQVLGKVREKLLLLFAAVGLVLLLGCVNVTHMTLARMAGRRREFAMRTALGASGLRLARQLLVENLLLSALGGIAGLLLAQWTIHPLVRMYPHEVPGLAAARLDFRVFAFALTICVLAGILFGLAPVLQMARANTSESLKDSGTAGTETAPRRWLRSALFVAEVALALLLSIAAGLTLRSLAAVLKVNPGFRADHLLSLSVIRAGGDAPGPQDLRFFLEAARRIRKLPGVQSASAAMCPPFDGTQWTSPYTPGGRAAPPLNQQPWTALNMVLPGYFQTMHTPLLRGRYFADSDNASSNPVAIVNETMARALDPQGDIIGKSVHVEYAAHPLLEIVGVVRDMKQWALEQPDMQEVYVPAAQMPVRFMTIVARTSIKPDALAHPATLAIQSLDKSQPVFGVKTFTAIVGSLEADRKFTVFMFGLFGALALLLAAVGVFGVMAYTVAQRTHEFGIRIALGAQRSKLLRYVLWQAARLALLGIMIGAVLAVELAPLVGTQLMLFEVKPRDTLTFGAAGVLLLLVSLLACYIPARRAMRVDPVTAIRCE